jgi:hypothetical protein
VANNNGSDCFLVAWQQYPSQLGGVQDLACSGVKASNAPLSNTLLFAINGYYPRAGGESLVGYPNVQVVWNDLGIRGAAISLSPTGATGVVSTYVLSTVVGTGPVSISRSGGDPGQYLAVWRGPIPGLFNGDLFVRGVSYNGIPDALATNITNTAALDEQAPAIDGNGTDFTLVYSRGDAPVTYDEGIYCNALHWTPGSLSWFSRMKSPARRASSVRRARSSSEPSHHTTLSGLQSRSLSSTHALSVGLGGIVRTPSHPDTTAPPYVGSPPGETHYKAEGPPTKPSRGIFLARVRVGGRWAVGRRD